MIILEHLTAIFITVHAGPHPESDNYKPDNKLFLQDTFYNTALSSLHLSESNPCQTLVMSI
jgi:hypothetical protein